MESQKLLLALISFIACVSLIDGGNCLFYDSGACDCGDTFDRQYRYEVTWVRCFATTGFPHFTKSALAARYDVLRMTITGNVSVIPKKAFAAFRNIKNLTLEHTAARQHQSWHASAFQGVKVLVLQITNLDGVIPIPKALEPLGTARYGLQYLEITGAGVVTLRAECFHNFSKLNKLKIERTAISSIDRDAFAGLENLVNLYIIEGGNEVTLQAGCFHSLSKLRTLEIERTTISSVDRDAFTGLSNLEELTITDATIPVGIRNLPNLQILSLRRTKISSIDRDAFSGLNNLKELTFQSTSLTEFPQEAMDHLTSLREIVLSGNEFNGPTVPGLRFLPRKVASCWLDNNGLTEFPAELISKTQFLYFLSLQNNNISSIIISTDFRYDNLEYLYLSGNPITSIDLGGKLPKLNTLLFSEQKLSRVDLSSFRGTQLRNLKLSNSPNLKSIFMSAEAPPFDYLSFTNTSLEWIDRSVAALFDRPHVRMYMHIDQNEHLRCDEGMKTVVETVFTSANAPLLFIGDSVCADKNISLDEYIVETTIPLCERLQNSAMNEYVDDTNESCADRLKRFVLTGQSLWNRIKHAGLFPEG